MPSPENPSAPVPRLDEAAAAEKAQLLNRLTGSINQVILGQETLIEQIIIALLAHGHVLLEGLPGLGKTELVKSLSATLGLKTNRVQFTPDLLPGDITGNPVLSESGGERTFKFHQGPIFTQLLLADEINRASPKTQSALLEAMQERQVTVMGQTYKLPSPFFVFATQNPIELEGTYPLPEAQLDRFLFKINVHRTTVDTLERIISTRQSGKAPELSAVLSGDELESLFEAARQTYLPDLVARYIARLVNATHPGECDVSTHVKFGASPRAAIGLANAVKARALLMGRAHASIEDVQALALPILGHRVIISYQARLDGETPASFVAKLLKAVPCDEKELPQSLSAAKIN